MKTLSLLAGAVAVSLTTMAFADGHAEVDPAVTARQAHMQLYAHNLGVLGGMAQGKIDYDADAAQSAADNMVALIGMNQMSYWPAGTDNASIEGTKALPALWENFDNVMVISADFGAAADAMADVAGTDLESLQGAMQALGGACSACHREYRQRN
ncbi:prepilin-type processing-associated H-X9-DG domain-containing protein [Octadecabacter temperatus]|uniref:Cytochrome c-554 n=1 Tax=Octadecabacter temperatus TaxID=1458307 RepID=A0A0K0Y4V7_9RHOB|nr:cytochrome c [Octadecabacter temperatus]AKS45970.1 Cytochrome c-554 precursor [Octadecabacter temperatus]SIO04677.1 prepilin-type processing-associated H-X9-DG domain-containing protein [Octadecabacter temperatus]